VSSSIKYPARCFQRWPWRCRMLRKVPVRPVAADSARANGLRMVRASALDGPRDARAACVYSSSAPLKSRVSRAIRPAVVALPVDGSISRSDSPGPGAFHIPAFAHSKAACDRRSIPTGRRDSSAVIAQRL
jgi:hypothetical protein